MTVSRKQLVLALALLVVCVIVQFATAAPLTPDGCNPFLTTMRKPCEAKIAPCAAQGSYLKWTGKGCRDKKGKPLGDGGCQCQGYCGYHCKGPCNKDSECKWKNNKCYVKATDLPGGPVLSCVTSAPTTAGPSISPSYFPTTSPTPMPTTQQPTQSPTTSTPTSSPTITTSAPALPIPGRQFG